MGYSRIHLSPWLVLVCAFLFFSGKGILHPLADKGRSNCKGWNVECEQIRKTQDEPQWIVAQRLLSALTLSLALALSLSRPRSRSLSLSLSLFLFQVQTSPWLKARRISERTNQKNSG